MNKLWYKWVRIVKFVVNIQTSIFFFVIYYIIILPMAAFIKVFSKNSLSGHGHNPKENSLWIMKKPTKHDLMWAKAQ